MSTLVDPRVLGEHIRGSGRASFSVRAFAAQTGFSPSFMSQLENGQVLPSLDPGKGSRKPWVLP
jgi:hypothetical protein